ncbi:MAG TPA: HAD hydrolase family protein [Candidatus Krumholzibacteria bacterium]|nr:HAD hydrolase family protein [Candidatus Krumholzibacteria bacterium]
MDDSAQSLWERAREIQALIVDVDGVLTDGLLYYGESGESLRAFSVRDGLGLALLREAGYRIAIISGRESKTVRVRARELAIDPVLLGRSDKGAALDEVLRAFGLPESRVAAMGDDILDAPMLARVGLSFAPQDAHEEIRTRVDLVTQASGGKGAVREACEFLLRARGQWEAIRNRLSLHGDQSWKRPPTTTV